MILFCSGYIYILDLMLLIGRLIGGHIYFYQLPCVYLAEKNCSEMACAALIDNEFAIARGIQAKISMVTYNERDRETSSLI